MTGVQTCALPIFLFLESLPGPWRGAVFAKKRPMRANVAVAGFGLQRTALLTGQAKAPSEAALAAFECFAPPRPPPSGGLQHGFGPVGCAALFKVCFDERLDCWPSTDVGGEEGSAADRASSLLEPAAWSNCVQCQAVTV